MHETSSIEVIDRPLAQKLLLRNKSNRPLSRGNVEALTGILRRGEWVFNGESISIDSDGNLTNGQHRLTAVVSTGIPIKTAVIRGVAPESFKTVDRGKKRNAADDLALGGEKNTITLAAATRNYLYMTTDVIFGRPVTTAQLEDCIREHPGLRFWTNAYVSAKTARIVPSSFVAVITRAAELHGAEPMAQFLRQVSSGESLEKGDPAYTLRERFLAGRGRTNFRADVALVFMIKAVNAYTYGKRMVILRLDPDSAFPAVE